MKRLLDILGALLILVMLSPLMVIVAILIRIFQGNPVFFWHTRLGKDNQEFKILKFCTMNNHQNAYGELLPDEDRVTSIGQFLRKTSIDEIPGFLNVLIGHMSIVGPRPLPPQYLDRYTMEQARRHNVKPGVTGWAQVNGRNAISWEEKFVLDVWYVDNHSLFLDIKILLLTIKYVLLIKGIVPDDKGAMEEFMGSKIGDKR
jgi:sugar transferase EpsL